MVIMTTILIAIYSDGVTEATGGDDEEFGQERLAKLLVELRERTAREIVEAVNQALSDWCPAEVDEDDVTLLVARRL